MFAKLPKLITNVSIISYYFILLNRLKPNILMEGGEYAEASC